MARQQSYLITNKFFKRPKLLKKKKKKSLNIYQLILNLDLNETTSDRNDLQVLRQYHSFHDIQNFTMKSGRILRNYN